MWSLNYDTNECIQWNRNRLTDIKNRLVVSQRSGGGMVWEFGISRCKLLYTEWINDKVLLHSKRKYIQYPVINPNGKECGKGVFFKVLFVYVCLQSDLDMSDINLLNSLVMHRYFPTTVMKLKKYHNIRIWNYLRISDSHCMRSMNLAMLSN